MTKWEYRTEGVRFGDSSEDRLNELGAEGWELVAVTLHESGARSLYLKRPITIKQAKVAIPYEPTRSKAKG
jgi:hypothetical protein